MVSTFVVGENDIDKNCRAYKTHMNTHSILEKHKKLKFPPFPNDEDFSLWVEELVELDAHYYGLVTSIVVGGLKAFDINLLEDLKQRLIKFEVLEDDKDTYRECEAYIVSLENIVQVIRENNY
ncbi:hypothetical protein [Niabella hibiscisoli]|uniref:hypothetical protein n=1 Tax=Niabella hibiscisoli TaxID=1825928 RepID=UPI001F112039|nr:hypothetical protein [Niabella hibiscisoli]MCH5720505.1 hypothetical protein [Niabella hibiscisoli]